MPPTHYGCSLPCRPGQRVPPESDSSFLMTSQHDKCSLTIRCRTVGSDPSSLPRRLSYKCDLRPGGLAGNMCKSKNKKISGLFIPECTSCPAPHFAKPIALSSLVRTWRQPLKGSDDARQQTTPPALTATLSPPSCKALIHDSEGIQRPE